jgi:hypothetical protein
MLANGVVSVNAGGILPPLSHPLLNKLRQEIVFS